MGAWKIIRLTEAAQVYDLIDDDDRPRPGEDLPLQDYYSQARQDDVAQALDIIGHALPRREVVGWAATLIEEQARKVPLEPRNRQALDSVLRWLGDGDDEYRRRAYEAAEAAHPASPTRLLGMAVFMSGGSLSPEDAPVVVPNNATCARLAVAAVKSAGYGSGDSAAFFEQALSLAEDIAKNGFRTRA